jgi:hypothetical protein
VTEDLRPDGLTDIDRANFHTLELAFANGDVAILHAREKATGQHHALLCVLSAVPGSEDTDMIPVARLIDGDVTEQYDNPTED